MKKRLDNVTLLGIDCVDVNRLKLALEICSNNFDFGAVKLLTSQPEEAENIIKINPINSVEEYSDFILGELDKYVDTPHVLIVQYDGFILNSDSWTDNFLEYDYIGAPWLVADWAVNNFYFPAKLLGKHVVGNGGFSLRSKKLLSLTAELMSENIFKNKHPEDVALCVYYRELLESRGIRFAPVDLAKTFSFEAESVSDYKWNGQFGFHGLKWTDISNWSKNNPQYKIDNPALIEEERLKYL